MITRSSAELRQNYSEIADICRKTSEPIFLVGDGEEDLVIMNVETYSRREEMLKLRQELMDVEEARMRGSKGYSIDEVDAMLEKVIEEA